MGIESASIRVGAANAPVVDATGFVEDLFGAAKTRWDVNLNVEGNTLAGYVGQRELAGLGALVGNMVIANSGGPLVLHQVDIDG